MSVTSDLRTIFHLVASPVVGKTHGERLESFYGRQAGNYDEFRKRLLHGREELYNKLPAPTGGHWVEMGGGTGANLEFIGDRIRQLGKVSIVDLSPSMIQQAQQRAAARGWENVNAVVADASRVDLAAADVIVFSYSLTMIPNWFSALECAIGLLKNGGVLGVVDFYVSRKYPIAGHLQHSWMTRSLWPLWFGFDNVQLNQDHVPYLFERLNPIYFRESSGKIPYLPLLRAPYFQFIGQKHRVPVFSA
jgi:S-adenosylmethionine-diacylgycerolhomoserine-N-methlytransferase